MSHVYLDDVIRIAQGEIGYHEKSTNANLDQKTAPNDGDGNWTKYARDLAAAGYYNGNKNGYAWCDVFVDWCIWMASGRDAAYAQRVEFQNGDCGAGCYYSASYYKAAGRFYAKPQPGDQVFFGDFEHTGLVEKVEGGMVYTIEGNSGNAVQRRSYQIGSSYIDGYGRPNYDAPDIYIGDGHDYSADARRKAIAKGIIMGVGKNTDGTINYNWMGDVTREELVTILDRMGLL